MEKASHDGKLRVVSRHEVVDVVVTIDDGARRFTGRCKCGWESPTCTTSVHALALVEDHGNAARVQARRRLLVPRS